MSDVATLSAQKAVEGLLASSSDINGSILDDTVKFFTDNGELKTAVNTKELVDSKILAGALGKIGKVPGAR